LIHISEVLAFLREREIPHSYVGNPDVTFEAFCPLNALKPSAITWVRKADNLDIEKLNSVEGIVLVAELGAQIEHAHFPILYAENVHRTFFRLMSHFFRALDPDCREPGIASTAVIETSKIGEELYVGHHTYIGPEVEIGNHVTILNNVTIQGRVTIGDYTTIESGTTIGACGFGPSSDEAGNPFIVSHLGGVLIGRHVKIGANNAISRGCLSDTVIEDYVQTDNLCHIAHNDLIKRGALLTANSVISGSTTIGENAWLAPGSLVNNAITVGKDAFLGLGAVATKDVPENQVVVGIPATPLRDRYCIQPSQNCSTGDG
jgi:UDP-3-O-[3-hydroxymyristoyl] glucosamine N-acyltransferase